MAFFRRIKDYFHLQKAIKRTFRPFFSSTRLHLETFEEVDGLIPQEIKDIYAAIHTRKGKKYARLADEYGRLSSEISSHNERIRRLQSVFESFNREDVFQSPEAWNKEKLEPYIQAVREAKGLSFPAESPYLPVYKSIEEVADNLPEIQRQHMIRQSLSTLILTIKEQEGFIRHEEVLAYCKRRDDLKAELASPNKHFYDFAPFSSLEESIAEHNEDYLSSEINCELFDDVGGVSLDQQQRRAAVSGEKNALIVAGAGSGKTTTICGRVRYLIERKGVKPSDILLLSYSKKSAEDLKKKVGAISPDMDVGTFHKIGLDVLKDANKQKYVVEEQYEAIVEEYFRDELAKDGNALRDVLVYYGLYLNGRENTKKYANEGQLFADLKKDGFITIKESLLRAQGKANEKETIKKERVKSFEEMALANFYFINGINYEYEKPYEHKVDSMEKRQYTPDFFLTDYGIYHEHYGIDREGRAKQYDGFEEMKYLDGITWKRNCHEEHNTACLETYSYEFSENTVFESLEKKLKDHGVVFRPLTEDQIWEALQSVYLGRPFYSFINLIKSFISLYKARYEDVSVFEELRQAAEMNPYGCHRTRLFLTICKRTYLFYMNRIRSEGKIDFDDMILQSVKKLPSLAGHKYKYLIVDEFQDISYSRMLFLKALIQHGNSDLFAVGDDWQSIYRFSGCDVNIFLHFSDYFGFTEQRYIENVHRNSQELQDIASAFVQKNQEQLRKNIHSNKSLPNPIKVIYYGDNLYSSLLDVLGIIAQKKGDANILLLGRNNRDIEPCLSDSFYYERKKGQYCCVFYPNLNIRFSTVHGSKGLEEDYVVLLSAEDAPNGFPNKTEDDPVLNLVMSSPSEYPLAEERRLWYVALTRTRSYVYILAPKDAPSSFLEEMRPKFEEVNPEARAEYRRPIHCPRCKGGRLVLREDKSGQPFYGCSNYPYCTYTNSDFDAIKRNIRCPSCGDFMVLRKGDHGAFYSCHSYPRCKTTKPYAPKKKYW